MEVRHIDGICGDFVIVDEKIFISFLMYNKEDYRIFTISNETISQGLVL